MGFIMTRTFIRSRHNLGWYWDCGTELGGTLGMAYQKHEKGMASGRLLLPTIRVFMHCDERSFVTWARRIFAMQKFRCVGGILLSVIGH